MGRAYSLDLRERVISAVNNGDSCRVVAARFDVAVSSVVKWSQRYRATGSVATDKMGGHRPVLLEPHRDFIIERLKQTPHLTVNNLLEELSRRDVHVCRDTVWRYLHREGLSFKKKPAGNLTVAA